MVSLYGNRLARWRARRRLAGHVLLAGHAAGLYLVDLAPWVRKYRRAQREVTLSLDRRRRIRATSFNLNAFCSHDCLALFRFLPERLGRLVDLLDINVSFPRTRLSVPPVECLAIVLRRLASPARWVDLEEFFGRSGSALCQIFYTTVVMMMDKWGALLTEWRMEFMRDRAALYAEKIEEAGAYLDRCVGFVDGTAIFYLTAWWGFAARLFQWSQAPSCGEVPKRAHPGRSFLLSFWAMGRAPPRHDFVL